ncbi:hypothetical protein SAY86_022302 [Trapa natans]|uniref:Transcriptional regulator SLK2 n=1 Tax=Trapa natans TaxID=22666 RepID=A0AAN7R6V0_TRANT|nr:hypothetical protein SAY86_022302 [Trapa natans]
MSVTAWERVLESVSDHELGLALESFLDSGYQGAVPLMVLSRASGGLTQSSSSSGVYYQGDAQSQTMVNSHLSSSFGNSSNSVPGTGRPSQGAVSGDMSSAAPNSAGNSGPSVGASSLVTDANSALSGGPHLQRSANGSSSECNQVRSAIMHQHSLSDQPAQQVQPSQQQQQGNSGATSLAPSQAGQVLVPMGARVPGSFIQDPNNLSHVQKKPRIDIKQEDVIQQQVLQQLLQRPDPMLQSRNPQIQALWQQQRFRQQHQQQQQQILQSMPHLQRAHLQQQQQQLQIRQQLQQQSVQPMNIKRPYDDGVCARKLMQYLFHQRQRPPDNAIAYWKKFVAAYFSPRAKKRWCLSLYENVGQHALGVFPQAAMDAWHCDICGSKSGRGFEATFEVLPRLNEIKFGSGVIDELLFLDLPKECRFPSGIMVLEYGKAVLESVYEQLRVVREGQLRIVFANDLKILSWEFCCRRHDELLPRRLVAPQVHQLVQVAQKCQSTIAEGGPDGISSQDLQANSNMVLSAGRQLAKSLELQSLNDLGFSKRYVRCLQISEVVNSMKDLIDFCRETKMGPIEALKSYPRQASAAKMQLQEMEQFASVQGLPTDRNTLNKLMAMQHPGLNSQMGNSPNIAHRGALSGSAQAALALTTGYQNLLMRQNSINTNQISLQQEASPFSNSGQSPSATFQSSKLLPSSGYCSPNLPPHQGAQSVQNNLLPQSPNPSQVNQTLQQQVIQQLLQEMSSNNNSRGGIQQAHAQLRSGMVFGNSNLAPPQAQAQPAPSSILGQAHSRSNSFKGTGSNSDSSAPLASGNNGPIPGRVPDLPQGLHLPDDLVSDIPLEFTENGFLSSDLDDTIGFGWKE